MGAEEPTEGAELEELGEPEAPDPQKAPRGKRPKRSVGHTVSVIERNKERGYAAFGLTCTARELQTICKVIRRSEDPLSGYQRDFNEKHARGMEKSLRAGIPIPGNLILSLRPEAQHDYQNKNKSLSWLLVHGAAAHLDGQHRLAAFGYADRLDENLLCYVYTGLSLALEIQIFTNVNGLGKPMNRSLILDIAAAGEVEKEREGTLRALFDGLREHERFSELLDPLGADRKLGRQGFNNAMTVLFSATLAKQKSYSTDEKRLTQVRFYLLAWLDMLPRDDKRASLRQQSLLAGLMDIMPMVTNATLAAHGRLNQATLRETIEPLVPRALAARGRRGIAEAINKALPMVEAEVEGE